MKYIYICGPYSGKDWDAVEKNIETARIYAVAVTLKGYYPITPHLMTEHLDAILIGIVDYNFWLEGTIDLMMKMCSHIILLPGWEKSNGAVKEAKIAKKLGLEFVDLKPRIIKRAERLVEKYKENYKITFDDYKRKYCPLD